MNTRQFLERRAALVTQLRDMQDTADANADGEMTADQASAFEKIKAALAELESAMIRRSAIETAERRMAGQPIGGTGDRRLDDDIGRRYSWARAIAGAAGLKVDDSYEREISSELARRSGRTPGGFFAPLGALNPPQMERRVSTTTSPTGAVGGNVIGTYLDPALFIPPLYGALVVRKAGARVITGLTSNVDIPVQSQSVIGSWVAENSPLTFSDPGFARVSLRPKHYGAITEFSRNMLLQATPDIEQLLRADMTNVLARGLDAAAINGTGAANDPVGILNQPGIATVPLGTNGGPMTWAAVLALVEAVELANVGDDARAFISNPKVRASLMQVPKVAATALGFLTDDRNALAGNSFFATTLVPSNGTKGTGTNLSTLIYGNFSDLLIGLWSEIDILVNPYAEVAYVKGNVQIRAMMTCDIEVRHPQSFAAITDAVAA